MRFNSTGLISCESGAYSHDLGLRSLIRGAEAYATRHASEPGERLEELVHGPSQCQKGIVN